MWKVSIVASALLLVGCNQSLFDSNVTGDASNSVSDSGDASGERVCPTGCSGDPIADFGMTQGGTTGRWFYLSDLRSASGARYEEMVGGFYEGEDAWEGTSGGPPAIVHCKAGSDSAVCSGAGESLVLVPSSSGAEDADPVLAYEAAADGSYRFEGSFRAPQAGGVPQKFLLSRNARHDLVHRESFATITDATSFSVDVELLKGDRVLLTLLSNGLGSPEPVAFDFYVSLVTTTEGTFPGSCQFAATFDIQGTPFLDSCGGANMMNLDYDPTAPEKLTQEGLSVNAGYGKARVFVTDNYMVSDGPTMDMGGDFTVQFWAKRTIPQASGAVSAMLSMQDTATQSGLGFYGNSEGEQSTLSYDWKEMGAMGAVLQTNSSAAVDGEWHFYRSNRIGDKLTFCIDGVVVGSSTQTAGFDMSPTEPLKLGRDFGTARYEGMLDDVRVFSVGLPCN